MSDNKVLDIKTKVKKESDDKANETVKPDSMSENDFESVIAANKVKQDKLKAERNKANKGVLRSYRIKN